jgi:hypothetical protein
LTDALLANSLFVGKIAITDLPAMNELDILASAMHHRKLALDPKMLDILQELDVEE